MPLRLVDRSLARPEENLALDEALLREVDEAVVQGAGADAGFLRFWESETLFVVLGVSSRVEEDVSRERSEEDGVPILRRASGGGTVLQGPGCLNVSIVVPLARAPVLRDVTKSYRWALERCIAGLDVPGAARRGRSDLALGDLKFAGSAQKRTPRVLLHHSSLLYAFDLALIERYLEEPRKQPEYRHGRRHAEFVTNLPLTAAEIRRRLAAAWDAVPPASGWRLPPLDELIAERYGRREWNLRF